MRLKVGVEGMPMLCPEERFRLLGSFWQHWAIHRRTCDYSGTSIISVFSDQCPYPVWRQDFWAEHADPPQSIFIEGQKVFSQLWKLFQTCPIPHKTGHGNENCDYTDDLWNSKNCYLVHSGVNCQDLKYCYRVYGARHSQFCVFLFDSELCCDVVNGRSCYNLIHSVNVQECRDSAFLYDCRNCADCMFCANLRHKQYCWKNVQLSKSEYQRKRDSWRLSSYRTYQNSQEIFNNLVFQKAWHRALVIDHCENCTGDYLNRSKNCHNCFFTYDAQDSVNCARGGEGLRDSLDCVAFDLNIELAFQSVFISDNCYSLASCYHITSSRFLEYCAFCLHCEHCFGCCGLVGKRYHIFNKPYSESDYHRIRGNIIEAMKQTGEYGQFFPGYFAANPYAESWAGYHFPLSPEEQRRLNFRTAIPPDQRVGTYTSSTAIPDDSLECIAESVALSYWDAQSCRPFMISAHDVAFAQSLAVPLPRSYYIARLQRNFSWIPFSGILRPAVCALTGARTTTSLPADYDNRLVSEAAYLSAPTTPLEFSSP